MRPVRLRFALLTLALTAGAAAAQTPASPQAPASQAPAPADSGGVGLWTARPDVGEMGSRTPPSDVQMAPPSPAKPRKRFEWLLAPLPMINPTLDNGLAVVVGGLYPIGDSPASATMISGFKTSNDSWMLGAVQTLHLHDDRYRATLAGAHFDINVDFYGIGADAGAAGVSVPMNQTGDAGIAEFLVRSGGRWYLGARYRLSKTLVDVDLSQTAVPIPLPDIDLRSGMLGPRLQRDSRNNPFYPTSGSLFDASAGFADASLGGRRTYQTYQAAFSSYSSLSPRQVVAAKINSCGTSGDVPFYDLCLLGAFQDLRGYPAGQYRDRTLLTAQAEYRLQVLRWFGMVAFAGTGEVAPSFKTLALDGLLPSGGGGLRFRLTKQTHVNLRIDYAWGKDSSALYMSVMEAF